VADVRRAEILAEFLAQAARTPFAWGGRNCLTLPADWVLARRGVDLAAGFRDQVRSASGGARFLKARGGLLAFATARAAACGLAATDAPQAGAVGVVEVETARGRAPVGAICTGPRWAVLGRFGLIVAPMATLAAWEV
jgi:hypothetical protein